MQVTVTGRNLDVPPAVKAQAVAKLTKVERLLPNLLDLEIVFWEERNPRIAQPIMCEVTLRSKGTTMHAQAAASDLLAAIDAVQEKLVEQVRRQKDKLVTRTHRSAS